MKTLAILLAITASHTFYLAGALAAEEAKPIEVSIDGFQFKPAVIRIKIGKKIRFTNLDAGPHTVTPESSSQFTGTGRMLKNESKEVVFTVAGSQKYFCEIHPSMKGTVEVTK